MPLYTIIYVFNINGNEELNNFNRFYRKYLKLKIKYNNLR